ncbi:MAG: PAS domain S-box protein [Deltaproteobacteria bacterium]|nr:PAS domain S-box protein [Deltaproteobacteria bacterium]
MNLPERELEPPLSFLDPGLSAWLVAPQIMIWMTNERHQCVYGNQALLDYFGFTFEMIQGLNWLETIHPDDRERIRRNHEFAASQCQNFRQEYRSKGKGRDDYIWVLDISVPRFDPKGKFLGYVGSVMDITEQKRQEQELKERQARLEKEVLEICDREKSRIGRDLHDDMSQCLLGIALKGMLLERKLKKRAVPESAIAGEITQEINDAIAKTRRISQSLFPSVVEQGGVLAMLNELAEKMASRFQVGLTCELPPRLSGLEGERAMHLFRIVQEAVTNSVRHGRARNIHVSFRGPEEGLWHLEVADDGCGIPQPFRPARGLGLQIMAYRAHALGGTMSVQPKQDGGTSITCVFPA